MLAGRLNGRINGKRTSRDESSDLKGPHCLSIGIQHGARIIQLFCLAGSSPACLTVHELLYERVVEHFNLTLITKLSRRPGKRSRINKQAAQRTELLASAESDSAALIKHLVSCIGNLEQKKVKSNKSYRSYITSRLLVSLLSLLKPMPRNKRAKRAHKDHQVHYVLKDEIPQRRRVGKNKPKTDVEVNDPNRRHGSQRGIILHCILSDKRTKESHFLVQTNH
ncbi:uncharacterized protein LOC111254217 [Varroa destructor]|uniref:Uncharacterized protein n=1 Tax=Varroa destructor TaxID=109461 RepID=A0A7M7KQS5_VARDE|nr:uncharacterized protein LOC111254217 [Varroa destructor]